MGSRFRGARQLVEYGAVRTAVLLGRPSTAPVLERTISGLLRLGARSRLMRSSFEHLDLAFGDAMPRREKERVVGRMLANLARVAAETARYFREGPDCVRGLVEEDETRARLEAAAGRRRGVIVLTAHFGNFELIPAWFTNHGYHGGIVTARLKNPRLDRYVVGRRARARIDVFPSDESPRALLSTLRSGGLVGIVPDQDIDHVAGTFAPFFGRPAWTPTGPASLARLSGAPILPARLAWAGERYRLSFDPVIDVPRTEDRAADVVAGTRAWSAVVEGWVRERPDHWVWFHPRWKTTAAYLRRRGRGHLILEARGSD